MGRHRWAQMHEAPELQGAAENNLIVIRLVSIAFLIAVLSTAIIVATYGLLEKMELAIVLISIVALVLASIAAKNKRAITIASHILVLTLLFFILGISFMSRGILSPPIVAIPFIPALCAKLFRPIVCSAYGALIFLGLMSLLFITPAGWSKPSLTGYLYVTWLSIVVIGTTAISLYVVKRNNELSKSLRYQSERDFLTDLPNRFKIHQHLYREVIETAVNEKCTAVMVVDVDHFKDYNDRNGHAAGDTALANVANRLRKVADANHGFVGRYGGEEFIFSVSREDDSEIEEIAESLRDSIAKMKVETSPNLSESLTITIGVATNFQRPSVNYETLINEADQALYRGKALGRNRVILDQSNIIGEHTNAETPESKMPPRKKPNSMSVLRTENQKKSHQ